MSERALYGQDLRALEALVDANDQIAEELFGASLPKVDPLPGCVVEQYRTVAGKTYGPYFFRVWREADGRQRKAYVRAADVEAVRSACAVHRAEKKRGGQRHRRALLRWRRDYGRMVDALCRYIDCQGQESEPAYD